ncbi:putative histidine kinase-like ATPase domain-containing protein [Medicago truncatula]|uniref:Putative histidine kinase-like ATPase domain-containing protein n=1 Tax=Medicago truncatula TaxID=3880 RepID=A0A396GDR6_MEDTR|nr:putative histidine kinase-like ATPase domain-containing protein [Medicago truncatula]
MLSCALFQLPSMNAEDNLYNDGVSPSLEFIITSKDITATGAPATLLIFNNEKGFSRENIESLCSVGRSTKKENRSSGYIGEKGIGFKSVFLVTAQPYIFSNGYQIRFNERPCPHCSLGYIVPEWVEEKPTLVDIQKIYGAGKDSLPNTIIVLPLKPDRVRFVNQQLSSIHPEVLLFLSKIRRLSVRENSEDPKENTLTAVSISSEINFETSRNMDAESYTIHLSAGENNNDEQECSYYIWKQKFPVKLENVVERRMGVEECVVTLAFPHQERLHKDKSLPGVFAFLPTEMVTNFPFIIQADFVLASSRETILLDDKWNKGILEYVPSAFIDAFKTLVTGSDEAPMCSLPYVFKFIPINSSPVETFNHVREKIEANLADEKIVPIETFSNQKHFCKPHEVSRLLPKFWNILTKAQQEGVYFVDLFSHGQIKILSSSFDISEYDDVLNFLGLKPVIIDWYANCIQSSNLVDEVSEDIYLELLHFIAKNPPLFKSSYIARIPLIKYVASDGFPCLFSIDECRQQGATKRVVLADSGQTYLCSWMINWNNVFACKTNQCFMPESTQQAIHQFLNKQSLLFWLTKYVNVCTLNVDSFAKVLCKSINNRSKLAVAYAHFLHHSLLKGYLTSREVCDLCKSMPLVDNYGLIIKERDGVLLPANVSKWAQLTNSDPWIDENYVELGKVYLKASSYAGQCTDSEMFIAFLKSHVKASDIPFIHPPNAGLSAADTTLTKENAFLLLDWIQNMEYDLPERFSESIKKGSWLKVTHNRYMPPSNSFLIHSSLRIFLQSGSDLVDIPLIDESFYGERINAYKEELKRVGVRFECVEVCYFIGRELMSRAASFSLTRNHVLWMLNFIQYLQKSRLFLCLDLFVDFLKQGSWLKTSHGFRSPVGSVLNDSGWQVASQISDIPFIGRVYCGEEIYNYKEELKLLGVIVDLSGNYQVVTQHLKSPSNLASLTAEAVLLIMECIKYSNVPIEVLNSIKRTRCFKTNMGFKAPCECFLYNQVWGCILEVFNGIPIIDHKFYGEKIFSYKDELKQIGVLVDFKDAANIFASLFKQKASETSINPTHVISFLSCYRKLKGTRYCFPSGFPTIIRNMSWLHSSVGDLRRPRECILYGPEWGSISSITCLPFIDDSTRIHKYKQELMHIGVVTELKDGVTFVPESLNFPSNPSTITPESVCSLMECIRLLMQDKKFFLEDDFKKRLSKKWLKTHAGYRPPEKSLLFNSKWSSFFNPTNGPFIDESFYGPEIVLYHKELAAIGVISEVEKGCSLLANHLESLSDHDSIVKIYKYLCEHNWKPEETAAKKVWILDAIKSGKWVDSEECIIHDPPKLFGSKYYVLEDLYDRDILVFFNALEVKKKPSLDDYVDLWNDWGSSVKQLSYDECCRFWTSISKHLRTNEEKKLAASLMKLPTTSGNNEIFLVDKEDVFIPDSLHMKKLFEKEKVFVWYPQYNMTPLSKSKLSRIYRKIGARNISESLCKEESSSVNDGGKLKHVDPNNIFNLKGLVKLILGFLACPNLKMKPKKRHEAVQSLVNSSFHETTEPINVSYSLSLSSGEIITKKANKRVRWESQSCKFIIQKIEEVPGDSLNYATNFSEAISEGILPENHDYVPALAELITLGYVMKFKNEEIDFLMESKNLQIEHADEEFLSSVFPSG